MGNNSTTKMYLGPKEMAGVITRERLGGLFGFEPALMNQLIFRLKKKGILKSIKKGVYFYSPFHNNCMNGKTR